MAAQSKELKGGLIKWMTCASSGIHIQENNTSAREVFRCLILHLVENRAVDNSLSNKGAVESQQVLSKPLD